VAREFDYEVGDEAVLPRAGSFTAFFAGANHQQRHLSSGGVRKNNGLSVEGLTT
jgi:hypothetical protein